MLNLYDENGNFVANLYVDSNGNLNIVTPLVVVHRRDVEVQTNDGDSISENSPYLEEETQEEESNENNFIPFTEDTFQEDKSPYTTPEENFEFSNPLYTEYDDNEVVQQLIHRLMQINIENFSVEEPILMDSVD